MFYCFWLAAFGDCAGMCKGVAYPLFLPAALRDLIGAVHTWNGQLLDLTPTVTFGGPQPEVCVANELCN